jgi:hypothetical protein
MRTFNAVYSNIGENARVLKKKAEEIDSPENTF